jgi:hypothetical protein
MWLPYIGTFKSKVPHLAKYNRYACTQQKRLPPAVVAAPAKRLATCSTEQVLESAPVRRYAIVGGGFAGVATAWHLLQRGHKHGFAIQIDVIDAKGIGEGASGVAAGLLHPFTPRGKITWRGMDGYNATLRLLEVAERAQGISDEAVCARNGILRYANDEKQAEGFAKNVGRPDTSSIDGDMAAGRIQKTCVSGSAPKRSQ